MGQISVREGLEVLRERVAPVQWKVPAFCTNDWAALKLAQMCRQAGAGDPFAVAYGSPQCVWSGGRAAVIRRDMSEDELERYFAAYKAAGMSVMLTFTRLEVPPALYANRQANLTLDVAARYRGEAVVVDDGLARYIRKQHPELRLVASFNKPLCELDPDASPAAETAYYRRLFDLYDEVVVRCEYALDNERIGLMTPAECGRCEVIVNQICVPNCSCGRRHMEALEAWDRGGARGPIQGCYHTATSRGPERLVQNLYISNARIDKLASMGVERFKIGGRNAPVDKFIDLMATYVFEPTGAVLAMKDVLAREYSLAARCDPMFAPYCLPR